MRATPLLLAAFFIVGGAGCSFRALQDNPLKREVTVDDEQSATFQIHQQIRSQMPLITDPVLTFYINALGQEIVDSTEPQPFVYRFFVFDSDVLNAFTIGGGYVYISSGVLAQAGDVNELVGVLAHEVAHVRRRHVAKAQENQGLASIAALAATLAIAAAGGDPGIAIAAQGINVALQIKNTREAEVDADHHGLEYMLHSSYDPDGMSRFFQRILTEQKQPGQEIPAYLFTHPALKERIAAVRTTLKRTQVPARARERTDPRLEQMQERLARIQNPVAGGSGLHARPEFDRSLTNPLLAEAKALSDAGDETTGIEKLTQAARLEPRDPRVYLERATLHEKAGELDAAREDLEQALALDSTVPLVQYRLGLIQKRLGHRKVAVFYLEQAAIGFKTGSSGRERADFQIRQLSFKVLDSSGLRGKSNGPLKVRFQPSGNVVWWGEISRHFMPLNPRVRVRWVGPKGKKAFEETVLMSPGGKVSSNFKLEAAPPGAWSVEVFVGDSQIDRQTFEVTDGRDASNPTL